MAQTPELALWRTVLFAGLQEAAKGGIRLGWDGGKSATRFLGELPRFQLLPQLLPSGQTPQARLTRFTLSYCLSWGFWLRR